VLTLRVIEDPAELFAHVAAWEDLAEHAIEPNPFYETWMLLPALEAFGRGLRLQFALVYEERPGVAPLLCGLFPLERLSRYRGLPLRYVKLWRYIHCFHGTPLVRASHARECLRLLIDWLGQDPRGAAAIEWGGVSGDGPFFQALAGVLMDARNRAFHSHRYSRAVLRPLEDAESYLGRALGGATRKELRRLERRLGAAGAVRYDALDAPGDAARWIEEFLVLERAGWKGRRGSALGSSDAGQRFFTRVATQAAERGRLMMLALRVAGRPVAMKCNFLAREGAFAFKIAYDESYARFSPGVLLELENIRRFHCHPELRWMDSCAAPDHFMANRVWLDRRLLANLVTATGRSPGDFVVSSLPLLGWVARNLRGGAAAAA
jgi:hypothetical protein